MVTNLLANLPSGADTELVEILLQNRHLKLERITSRGDCARPDHWYDQDWHEWVLLLQGSATLAIAGQHQPVTLVPGDSIFLPAHRRHAVTWTDPRVETLWLALHFQDDAGTPDGVAEQPGNTQDSARV